MTAQLGLPASLALVGSALVLGAYVVEVLDHAIGRVVSGHFEPVGRTLTIPIHRAALLLLQQTTTTERPDAPLWLIAPAFLAGLAAAGLAIVPLGPSGALANVEAGIVWFGAVGALVMVAVYAHGWAPNSVMPLIGGYRFVALALSYEMPLALVLIAAALPARALALPVIVASQADLWNVVRQPLGLPLYLIAGLGLACRRPLDFADSADLAGGTLVEASGVARLAWSAAKSAMLVAVAAIGATVFLGGWLGPWLPGPAWVVVKTLALLALLVTAGHLVARPRLERFVVIAWVGLIPLALVNVFLSGLLLLL
ncbi:MAG: NADH-quinone oxidoreductase subunit H [Gemmatimonadales bacterium]|nr:NADH-quinone oxidoreductase subunit H [Gemmatimonadales bacterium]